MNHAPTSHSRQGFLLTRQQQDAPQGIELLYWLRAADEAFSVRIPAQEAVFFIHDQQRQQAAAVLAALPDWRAQKVALQDLRSEPVTALYFRSLKSYRRASELLQQAGIAMMEEDIRHCDRYLMERFIQGGAEVFQQGDQVRLRAADLSPQFRILSLDIETTMRADKLLSIALYADDFELVLMRGQGSDREGLKFHPDEAGLLRGLMAAVKAYDPDIFIGWNVVGFDFRVLEQRAQALGIPLRLGRDSQAIQVIQSSQGKAFVRMGGRLVLDGIDTLRGATWQFESFSLEYVSRQMLDRGKLIDHVGQRGDEIQRLFREDKEALARYNLEDCRLVWQIFEKAQLLHYLIERTRLTGLALDKVGGSAAAFDNQYLPLLHRRGYVAPEYATGQSGLGAPGGYVMDSLPGLYRQVLVLDFKSLYPSIIRTFRVDPLGMVEGLKEGADESDLVPGFNQAIFSASQSILPGLIERLWQARDRAKRERNAPLSQAIKIIMNSFYGVLGSNLCRFYDQRLSSSITLRGHQILMQTREEIERRFGHQVIYGDTDSVFVWLGDDYPEDQADARGQELATYLNGWWQQLLQQKFGLPCHLELEYETHYSRFLMPRMRHSEKGTKKRYAGLQQRADGSQRMVFKGLENVRTDWTPLARQFQEQLYERIFREQPWQALLTDTVHQVLAGERDSDLVYRRRIRQPLSEYRRNRPPHVQAAEKAERQWLAQGLPSPYHPGKHVHYVMTVNGPEPEEFLHSSIDYQHYIDKQLKPVADAILPFLGYDCESLIAPQQNLF
ncbi:DNA polymerase II [Marinobacterium jannaschii]|uniref:DNA polymerase II n=1 Tax=Marinobacterium jannaschii TaxID=64970 RepID=UPI00048897EC|nr:DNA polymerase II [Marinobacterium jannaschii]